MIVRRVAAKAYRSLNAGDYQAIVGSFRPDGVLCFVGDHAMGGELHGVTLIHQWFQRVFRLFPDLQFQPRAIVVGGMPWNTVVTTRFTVRATLPDGRRYANEGMQFLRLRWGRIVEDRLYEDTQALTWALATIAALGNEEATAAPLAPVGAGPGVPRVPDPPPRAATARRS